MTYVKQFSNFSLDFMTSNLKRVEYMVEVVNFDNESEIVYVEAGDESEALELAASMVVNADYAMIQGVLA